MEATYALVARWAVPLWCVAVFAVLSFGGWKRRWWPAVAKLSAFAAIIAAFPLLSLGGATSRSTQVIYRFDDHRYLELAGFACEGALYFNDTQKRIRTEVVSQFYQLWLKPFIHPSKTYIAIPQTDGSSFLVSNDEGLTFETARYATYNYSDTDDRPPYGDMMRFVVVNNQGFLELNNGRLYMSSKPFGDNWGGGYVDAAGLKHSVLADFPQFQGLPTSTPPTKGYSGWTRMQCNPDIGAGPFDPVRYGQALVFDFEAWTVGSPVYWGLRSMGDVARKVEGPQSGASSE